jgi:tRNA A-37 threonylcarbamoyl transferase component Bud32
VGASEPAEKLGDRYAIYGEIASGGMASVHFARLIGPVGFSRTVAVKRLHANLREQEEFVRMFLDEARLATRVRHPNVVATIDVIETETQICLVMEYVHGESLRRLARAAMSQAGRVPRRFVAAIIVGALHGLHAAHEAKNERGEPLNMVHRDVSPHNIIVGTDGIPRVIDFGIAKAKGQLRDTDVGTIKGKFAYMAPEQLVGANVTRSADIYAASVLLWELLTGRRLFGSKIDTTVLERARVQIAPPSTFVPSLTPALDGIVLRGLSPDPDKRFPSAREMARAIEDCIAPASTADVGEWVERMAHERLAERERQLAEIDELEGPDAAAKLLVPTRPVMFVSGTTEEEAGPPSESAVVAAQSRPSEIDTLELPPASVYGPEGRALPPEEDDGPEPPTAVDRHPVTDVALGAPAGRRAGSRLSRRVGFGLLVALAFIAIAIVLDASGYVTKRVASAAALRGFSFTAGEVVFRPSAVVLTGNRVEPLRLSDVTLGVGDVEVTLRHLTPGDVLVRGFEATLRGGLGDVADHITSWSAATSAPLQCEARSGHLQWTDPFGPGTFLEAWDVAVQVSPGKLSLVSPSVLIRTPHGKLGPWKVHFERTSPTGPVGSPGESRLEVAFDPTLPTAGLQWSRQAGNGQQGDKVSVTLEFPRAPLSRIGIPSEAVGVLGDVEVAGRVAFNTSASPAVEGQMALSFFGLRGVGGRAAPTDAALVARLGGASEASLELEDGMASVGTTHARATGTLALDAFGAALDLTLAWPAGTKGLPGSLALDTRDLPSWGRR